MGGDNKLGMQIMAIRSTRENNVMYVLPSQLTTSPQQRYSVAQAVLESQVFLPQPPETWGSKCAPACPGVASPSFFYSVFPSNALLSFQWLLELGINPQFLIENKKDLTWFVFWLIFGLPYPGHCPSDMLFPVLFLTSVFIRTVIALEKIGFLSAQSQSICSQPERPHWIRYSILLFNILSHESSSFSLFSTPSAFSSVLIASFAGLYLSGPQLFLLSRWST